MAGSASVDPPSDLGSLWMYLNGPSFYHADTGTLGEEERPLPQNYLHDQGSAAAIEEGPTNGTEQEVETRRIRRCLIEKRSRDKRVNAIEKLKNVIEKLTGESYMGKRNQIKLLKDTSEVLMKKERKVQELENEVRNLRKQLANTRIVAPAPHCGIYHTQGAAPFGWSGIGMLEGGTGRFS